MIPQSSSDRFKQLYDFMHELGKNSKVFQDHKEVQVINK